MVFGEEAFAWLFEGYNILGRLIGVHIFRFPYTPSFPVPGLLDPTSGAYPAASVQPEFFLTFCGVPFRSLLLYYSQA